MMHVISILDVIGYWLLVIGKRMRQSRTNIYYLLVRRNHYLSYSVALRLRRTAG